MSSTVTGKDLQTSVMALPRGPFDNELLATRKRRIDMLKDMFGKLGDVLPA